MTPQIIMAGWLATSIIGSLVIAYKLRGHYPALWRVPHRRFYPKRVRGKLVYIYPSATAATVAFCALAEGALLWSGGFWG